jgi:hypothetical protein
MGDSFSFLLNFLFLGLADEISEKDKEKEERERYDGDSRAVIGADRGKRELWK